MSDDLKIALDEVSGAADCHLVLLDLTGSAGLEDDALRSVATFVAEVQRHPDRSTVVWDAGRHGLHLGADAMIMPGAPEWLFQAWLEGCARSGLLPLVFVHAHALTAHIAAALDRERGATTVPFPLLVELRRDADAAAEMFTAIRQLSVLRMVLGRRRADAGRAEGGDELVDACTSAAVLLAMTVLEAESLLDALTGLLNRRALGRDLPSALSAAERDHHDLSVVMIDIDGLKALNDIEGHGAGDGALRAFADAWRTQLRLGDDVYRVGGDEFVLLLHGVDSEEAQHVLHRAFDRTAQPFSWGVATFPGDGIDGSRLLDIADRRLIDRRTGRERRSAARPNTVPT